MKPDLYTKIVLTVIALCHVVLTVNQVNPVPEAKAEPVTAFSGLGDQIKANYDGSINVRVVEFKTPYDCLPVEIKKLPYGSLPVAIKNRQMDVNVKNNYIYTKPY